MNKIDDALYAAVLRIVIVATNEHLKDNLPKIISRELATRVPKMIEDLFKEHMEFTSSNVRSSSKDSIAYISDLQDQKFGKSLASPFTCIPQASYHHDQDDHQDDNHEGEKHYKKKKSTFGASTYASQPPIPAYYDNWSAVHEIDDGVDISEEADTEFLAEILVNKWVPTTATNLVKMQFAHNNILKSQCKTRAKYKYHH
ncbi:hypothetical protein Tco_0135980 [Tanacetum coccineum]